MYRKMELSYWLVTGNMKNNRINWLNEKSSLIPRGLKLLIWKVNFCSRVLWLLIPSFLDVGIKAADCHMLLRTIGKCSPKRSPSCFLVLLMYNFLQRVAEVQVTCTLANVMYCITCTLCKKVYISKTGRGVSDWFREHHLEKDDKHTSKPVARHL